MLTNEEIQQLGAEELKTEIAKQEQELLKLKLLTHSGQSKETSQIKLQRKTIARMKTYQTQLSKSAN